MGVGKMNFMDVKNIKDGIKWVREILAEMEKVDKIIYDDGFSQVDKLIFYSFLYQVHLNMYSKNFKCDREELDKQINKIVSEMVNNIKINEKYK
jgi:hypothetical protein